MNREFFRPVTARVRKSLAGRAFPACTASIPARITGNNKEFFLRTRPGIAPESACGIRFLTETQQRDSINVLPSRSHDFIEGLERVLGRRIARRGANRQSRRRGRKPDLKGEHWCCHPFRKFGAAGRQQHHRARCNSTSKISSAEHRFRAGFVSAHAQIQGRNRRGTCAPVTLF